MVFDDLNYESIPECSNERLRVEITADDFALMYDACINYTFMVQSLLPAMQDKCIRSGMIQYLNHSSEVLRKVSTLLPDSSDCK